MTSKRPLIILDASLKHHQLAQAVRSPKCVHEIQKRLKKGNDSRCQIQSSYSPANGKMRTGSSDKMLAYYLFARSMESIEKYT